jgi:hypothetical protein
MCSKFAATDVVADPDRNPTVATREVLPETETAAALAPKSDRTERDVVAAVPIAAEPELKATAAVLIPIVDTERAMLAGPAEKSTKTVLTPWTLALV